MWGFSLLRPLVAAAALALAFSGEAAAADFYVRPDGSDLWNGTIDNPLRTIQAALERAFPGDVVHLLPGLYENDVATIRDGTADHPITILGTADAVVVGAGSNRIFAISHDYIRLEGFMIDGHFRPQDDVKNSYRDKLVYVMALQAGEQVTGFQMTGMFLQNAGSECVRLRYGTTHSQIWGNYIRSCGNWDFRFSDGGKNGEGIYVGTAPEQLGLHDAPSAEIDHSNENWIHHNFFDTRGNECVDLKESSTRNVVEFNTCTGQVDSESGGIDSRGSGNIIRFNEIYNNVGVGIRLGGDSEADGTDNEVYGNLIRGNVAGGIRVQRAPQALLCDNRFEANGNKPLSGTFSKLYGGTERCDVSKVTDMAQLTGHAVILTASTVVGAGPLPEWPQGGPVQEATIVPPVTDVPTTSEASVPSTTTTVIVNGSQPLERTDGYKVINCPSTKANCIIGIFHPGEGLAVLQATDPALQDKTIGFADALVDNQKSMVDPASLSGAILAIEYDRAAPAGLVGPVLTLVLSTGAAQ